jgi:chorismate lyase/3-hydroxybenzoate synthase
MIEPAGRLLASAAPRVAYLPVPAALDPRTLALVGFGSRPLPDDPRVVRVNLEPLAGAQLAECWHAQGAVRSGRADHVRWAADDSHLFGVVEIDEREVGGIEAAAREAYARIRAHTAQGAHPHLLRLWNFIDAINAGSDDDERYRRFCVGRAAGLALDPDATHAAATAIGRRDGVPLLQVLWLAARDPGRSHENPRQVSAYRYPRQYGPTPPSFARAMRGPGGTLYVSGTASVVGHETRHPGELRAQLDETLHNLGHLLAHAARQDGVPTAFGLHSPLKVYLRDRVALAEVEALLRQRLPPGTPYVVLEGDICRGDLLVEIDGTVCLH